MSGERIRRIRSRGEIAAKYFRSTSVNARLLGFPGIKAIARRRNQARVLRVRRQFNAYAAKFVTAATAC